MALVWVPATQLMLLGGTAGQAGPAMSDHKKTGLPPKKLVLSHSDPSTGRISARWNTDTDIQTTHLFTE